MKKKIIKLTIDGIVPSAPAPRWTQEDLERVAQKANEMQRATVAASQDDSIAAMVRDFCAVGTHVKSEVRRRLLEAKSKWEIAAREDERRLQKGRK